MRREGYFTIDRDVLARLPEIGPVAFAAFAVLASHADEHGECWPSHETLSRIVGVSDRTVRRALVALESAGLISRTHRRRDTAVYSIQARTPVSAQELSPDKNDRWPRARRPAARGWSQ